MGFIRMFTMVAGVLLILSSVPAGISAVDPELVKADAEFISIITDKIIVGKFVSGAMPMLWIGIGSISAGTLLSNWMGGIPRQISDILRMIVLGAIYPTVLQFTKIMIDDEPSLTLIPPLLGGLAVTLISATILFKKYRKHKDQEMISD